MNKKLKKRKGIKCIASFTQEEVKGITTFKIKGINRLVIATTKGVYYYPSIKEPK